MKDNDCVQFLQWALPQMQLRWPGFRKVRGQVCKRIERRIRALRLSDIQAYRDYLRDSREEWRVLDGLGRIPISRFYRDKRLFVQLEQDLLPQLAEQVLARGERELRIWSAGCASGEEPYTLALLWTFALHARFPKLKLRILATDADPHLLQRAQEACYGYGSVKNLPDLWIERGFSRTDNSYCLHPQFRKQVEFRQQDLREAVPDGPLHLVLCRNLVFTYFESPLQQAFLARLRVAMHPQGLLLLGVHESLPEEEGGFAARSARWGIYEKRLSFKENGSG